MYPGHQLYSKTRKLHWQSCFASGRWGGETFRICKSQFWSQLASKTFQQKDKASAVFNTRCQEVLIEEKEWWLCSTFDPKIHILWPCIMHSPHKHRHNLFLDLRVAILILGLHAWAYLAKKRCLWWKVCFWVMLAKCTTKVTSQKDSKRIHTQTHILLAFYATQSYRRTCKFKGIQLFPANWLLRKCSPHPQFSDGLSTHNGV